MLPFSTEFPVKSNQTSAAFVAEVIAWLRGNGASTVLGHGSEKELEGENAFLVGESGEELRFREIREGEHAIAVGFRHDFPDNEGRIWRTEGVLRRGGAGASDLVRFRTQCRAAQPGARLDVPKKPYLIKALLKNGWSASDGHVEVSDAPIWLHETEQGLQLAASLTEGTLTRWLPALYVSATDSDVWGLSETEIEKLAYDLGGVAHVVVEPNRRFSFKLRDLTAGRNVYSGAVGIALPGSGIVGRLFIGWQMPDSHSLVVALKNTVTALRERMPVKGWDWSDLQELSLRKQRNALQGAAEAKDIEELFDGYVKEIEEIKSDKRVLEVKIAELQAEISNKDEERDNGGNVLRLMPEIYPGEVLDRLRYAANLTLNNAEAIGLDRRTLCVLQKLAALPSSPDLRELKLDLERATKDPKRVAGELFGLLQRHGYYEKSDNKHIRLEAQPQFEGLDAITLPKTPSENRGLKNLRKQIESILGLTKL
ncbi:MAG: hypothetical protein ACXIUO_00615 [Erythrobacter sp.]